MKADPFVQLRLLDLQSLDSAVDRLAHRRRTLPEISEIARLDALLEALRDDLVRAETLVSDLAREQARFEREIDQVRTRRDRDQQRLGSGEITNPKQLQDLEHEVATLRRRQAELEEQELEVMERAESGQAELDLLVAQRDRHLAGVEEASAARDRTWQEIDVETARLAEERGAVTAELPADLLALYEKIRAAHGGIGAGPIARGACGACRLDLMGNEKAEARAAAPDAVLRHEECGRILVRTAESAL